MVDSGIDTTYSSDMESITSSAYEHRYGRRRYHGVVGNPYPLPNDDEEKDRLDELQLCFRQLVGRNVVAPIRKNPTQIVDVGTGSGRWVLEVAEDYPNTRVTGTDISPIQPSYVPPNTEFLLMDLTGGLGFHDGSVDLVHSRLVHAGVTVPQWPDYISEIYRILKPNEGWTQLIELDFPFCISKNDSLPKDSELYKMFEYMQTEFRDEQQIFMSGSKLEQLLLDAGFVDVKSTRIKVEIGDWGSNPRKHRLAQGCANVWSSAIRVIADQLTKQFPNEEERSDFAEAASAQVRNLDYQLHCYLYLVIGRKPQA